MPRNAIATGLIDEVLNVEEIPAKIIAYKSSLGKIQISEEAAHRPQDQQQALREIFTEIRYAPATISPIINDLPCCAE